MCEFCENRNPLLTEEVISPFSWGWGLDGNGEILKISEQEAQKYNISVFIDRGFLRLVDSSECQCIEGGQKMKINYCPSCGNKII